MRFFFFYLSHIFLEVVLAKRVSGCFQVVLSFKEYAEIIDEVLVYNVAHLCS